MMLVTVTAALRCGATTAVSERCNMVTLNACMGIRQGHLPGPAGRCIINLTAPLRQAEPLDSFYGLAAASRDVITVFYGFLTDTDV